jgi:hypothetical protein
MNCVRLIRGVAVGLFVTGADAVGFSTVTGATAAVGDPLLPARAIGAKGSITGAGVVLAAGVSFRMTTVEGDDDGSCVVAQPANTTTQTIRNRFIVFLLRTDLAAPND